MKFLFPIILIIFSITGLFVFVEPLFGEIKQIRAEVAQYNKALENSKALENIKDKLTEKSNSISGEDIKRIEKMLPIDVDNIRLIVEIQNNIAVNHGMFLRDIKYNLDSENPAEDVIVGGTPREIMNRDYGEWGLQFTVEGTYPDFIRFLKDLESNLRLVDVVSVEFSSVDVGRDRNRPEDVYKYSLKIKTYWLK